MIEFINRLWRKLIHPHRNRKGKVFYLCKVEYDPINHVETHWI